MRRRRGFSLLEVMVALGILVVSLVILVETQSTSVRMTYEAQRMVTATQLAHEKLNEVVLKLEEEGFSESEITESGNFSDFGDQAIDIEFRGLADYRYDWSVAEIDVKSLSNLTAMAQSLGGSGSAAPSGTPGSAAPSGAGGLPGLGALGISGEMLTELLGRYIREVQVTVWWGDSWDKAEERGDFVALTTHVTNPSGQIIPGAGNVPPDAPPGGMPPGAGQGGMPGGGGGMRPSTPQGPRGMQGPGGMGGPGGRGFPGGGGMPQGPRGPR